MTTLRERIETTLPIDDAFAYVADFANSQEWDPGVATAQRLDDGPIGLGSRFRLGVRLGPRVAAMEYRISVFEPPTRVVLVGSGSGVSAVDDIRFERLAAATTLDYTADIRLRGPFRLIEPFLGGAFENIGRNAAHGMQGTLDAQAAALRQAQEHHEQDGRGAA
jgi:dehydrogenase/reductase SDR family protein 12